MIIEIMHTVFKLQTCFGEYNSHEHISTGDYKVSFKHANQVVWRFLIKLAGKD